MNETKVLRAIQRLVKNSAPHVRLGVGDDAAVLQTGGPTVLCTDMLVESVDFERSWASFSDVGHKAAAVNLSDLAAMGATPKGLLLSIACSAKERERDVLSVVRAVHRLGMQWQAPLIGGDLSSTKGPWVVSVTAVGHVQKPWLRHQANVGDVILVSGTLGGAAMGLQGLMNHEPIPALWRQQQLRPTPQVALALCLKPCAGIRSATDISDGLSADVLSLAPKGLGVELDCDRLPLAPGASRLDPVRAQYLALCGGEDFQLVFAVSPKRAGDLMQRASAHGFALTAIGRVVTRPGLHLLNKKKGLPNLQPFVHWKLK